MECNVTVTLHVTLMPLYIIYIIIYVLHIIIYIFLFCCVTERYRNVTCNATGNVTPICLLNRIYVRVIITLSLPNAPCGFSKGMGVLDYKKCIIAMLDLADERRLRLIYVHIRALLGLR